MDGSVNHDRGEPELASTLGLRAYQQDQKPVAIAAFRIASTVDADAFFKLGLLLAERGHVEGARAAYQSAIDSGHAEAAPGAAVGLGVLLAEQGDVAGARAAYQSVIDRAMPTWPPRQR